ncbi:MAG: hypothetical protein DRO15_05050, partial [Thermoprotei archaeon]
AEEYLMSLKEIVRLMEGDEDIIDLKPLGCKYLVEDAYVICGKSLIHIGSSSSEIPGHLVFNALQFCKEYGDRMTLHTHPVPLPIPSPSDILNALQLSKDIECVGSRIYDEIHILCLSPKNSWKEILEIHKNFGSILFDVIKHYIPIENENGSINFIPYPTKSEATLLEELLLSKLNSKANTALIKCAL